VEVVVLSETNFSGGCYGSLFRLYRATDNCGNYVESYQIIHIIDQIAPQIFNVPGEITIACGTTLPAVPTDIAATDNCATDVAVVFSQIQTNEFCPYDVIRTWTATDNCGNTTTRTQTIHVTVTVPVSINLNVYPNPASDVFTLEFSTPSSKQVNGAIYDLAGREVISVMNGVADGGRLYKKVVSTSQLNAGTYIVKMIVDGEAHTKKFIVLPEK
jgi:hypothetical protein